MYSEEIRTIVYNMNQDNKKCSEIARSVGLSIRSVYSILTYKKKIYKKKCGPKPKID